MTAVAVPESSEAVRRKLRRNRQLRRWSFQGFLGFAAIIWIIPLLWMLSLSLSDNDALQRDTTSLIPIQPTLNNFTTLFESGRTPSWMWNSIVVTVTTTFLTLVLSSMAGYAFARIPFRGKRIAFPLVLAGLMVPKEAMFIPLFLIFADFDQHNTYHALVLPRVAAPLGVFIMTQFFSAIPADLEEAAVIDGANRWTIFRRIMLPMSVPALTALGIFTFVLTWNDFLWPLVSATDPDNFTITTGLASRQGNFAQANALGDLMAQGVFASLPLLILFFIFQRQVIRGISLGSGGKG
jgi:multiple sugar transport system permease protein